MLLRVLEALEIGRKARGWTQREMALAAGTSQSTLSAYERREKSPSLAVTERLIGEAGYSLRLDVTVDFTQVTDAGSEPFWVPNLLWRLESRLCFSRVQFPDTVAVRESGEWGIVTGIWAIGTSAGRLRLPAHEGTATVDLPMGRRSALG